MHVCVTDQLTEVPQPCDGTCGILLDELAFQKSRGSFRPWPAGESKPAVVDSCPGTQRGAAAQSMAIKANRFEEGAVSTLKYARLCRG